MKLFQRSLNTLQQRNQIFFLLNLNQKCEEIFIQRETNEETFTHISFVSQMYEYFHSTMFILITFVFEAFNIHNYFVWTGNKIARSSLCKWGDIFSCSTLEIVYWQHRAMNASNLFRAKFVINLSWKYEERIFFSLN